MFIIEKLQENTELTLGKFNIIEFARNYLWRDLALWSSAYLISIYSDPAYQESIFRKLYSIPLNFYTVISVIFGTDPAKQITNLVSQHIILLQSLISAMASGDQNAVNDNATRLYQNADAMAALLGQINPYWDENIWRSFLYHYIELIFQEMMTYFTKDYDTSVQIYDRLVFLSTQMGDYFADGLIKYLVEKGATL